MSNDKSSQSKFGTGLLIGFLTGATSYFLFNTDEGRELRGQLKDRWQTAADNWPQLSEIKVGDLELEELAKILLGIDRSQRKKLNLKFKTAKRSGTKKNKKLDTFKGV